MQSQAESALDSWREWSLQLTDRPTISGVLADGLTNQSFVLETSQGDAVLRIPHPQSEALGIDRQREQLIIKALQGKRINTDVWFHDETTGIMVSRHVAGKVYSADELSTAQKTKVNDLIHRYQAMQLDLPRFDYVTYLQEYRERLLAYEQLSPGWESEWQCFLPKLINLQNAGWKPVLCHHDLKGKNLIDTNDAWVLVDWEYAAMGHPALDLLSCGLAYQIDAEERKTLLELIEWMERYWFTLQKYNHQSRRQVLAD